MRRARTELELILLVIETVDDVSDIKMICKNHVIKRENKHNKAHSFKTRAVSHNQIRIIDFLLMVRDKRVSVSGVTV